MFKIENALDWYWRQVFCGYWIMVSILAGVILITLLFSLSTIEKLFTGENWKSPMNLTCKKVLFTWICLGFAITLITNIIFFLINFYNFLNDDNSKFLLIKSCFLFTIWCLVLILTIMICQNMIKEIFADVFEKMEDIFS